MHSGCFFCAECRARRAVSDRLDRMIDTCFFRQNARMKHKWLTRGNIDKRKICAFVLMSKIKTQEQKNIKLTQ